MKSIYGFILIGYLVGQQILKQDIDMMRIAVLLGVLCFFIIKERFVDNAAMTITFFVAVSILGQYHETFVILLAIPLVDFLYWKKYVLGGIFLALSLYSYLQIIARKNHRGF